VQKQALHTVPGQRAPTLAPGARTELLPTRYVHAVFTLPRELAPLALQNKRLIYNLLFHSSAETLLRSLAIHSAWSRDRLLQRAPQLEPAPAVSSPYPLCNCRRRSRTGPLKMISARRSSSCPSACSAASSAASSSLDFATHFIGELQFHGSLLPLAEPHAFARWLRVLFRHDWVVYSKPPFGGPEHVLRYLGAYTHRVAISNSRLVALSMATSPSAGAIPPTATRRGS